jgi:hypothetical protein
MLGVVSGSTYTARGFTGSSYGFYPNQGNVSKKF